MALIRGLLGALVYEHGPKDAAGEGKPDRFYYSLVCMLHARPIGRL